MKLFGGFPNCFINRRMGILILVLGDLILLSYYSKGVVLRIVSQYSTGNYIEKG